MLKIVATVNNRQTLFLGMDRTNTTRLHAGQPIAVDLQALMASVDDSVQDIVLCAAETLDEPPGRTGQAPAAAARRGRGLT